MHVLINNFSLQYTVSPSLPYSYFCPMRAKCCLGHASYTRSLSVHYSVSASLLYKPRVPFSYTLFFREMAEREEDFITSPEADAILQDYLRNDNIEGYSEIFWPHTHEFEPQSVFENPTPSTSFAPQPPPLPNMSEPQPSTSSGEHSYATLTDVPPTECQNYHEEFSCPNCKKWFLTSGRFQKHLDENKCYFRESDTSHFHCPYPLCNSRCKTAYTLKRHIR